MSAATLRASLPTGFDFIPVTASAAVSARIATTTMSSTMVKPAALVRRRPIPELHGLSIRPVDVIAVIRRARARDRQRRAVDVADVVARLRPLEEVGRLVEDDA